MHTQETHAAPVSVIMATYNGEAHLAEAVDSILAQTFRDFAFIIVDDASTDGTPEILRRYAARDSRITVLTHERNMERAVARNTALSHARSEWIAVLDDDDVAVPDRLERQLAFMRAHPHVLACGGYYQIYETRLVKKKPLDDAALRRNMLWYPPFFHTTSMFRRDPCLRVGGYSPDLTPSDDYELWRRLALLPGGRFANIDAILARYRTHPQVETGGAYRAADRATYRAAGLEQGTRVRKAYLLSLGVPENALDMDAHMVLSYNADLRSIPACRAQAWAEYLIQWNQEANIFDARAFADDCRTRLHDSYVQGRYLPACLKRLLPSPLKRWVKSRLYARKLRNEA